MIPILTIYIYWLHKIYILLADSTTVNNRSSKINDIFYIEFNSLLWEDTHRREFKTSLIAYEKMINAKKNIVTIAYMTNVNNEKCEL